MCKHSERFDENLPSHETQRLLQEEQDRKSVLDAIQAGEWDFEPEELSSGRFDSTAALPGSDEKLAILARRAEQGLPLWNDEDCIDYEQVAQRTQDMLEQS